MGSMVGRKKDAEDILEGGFGWVERLPGTPTCHGRTKARSKPSVLIKRRVIVRFHCAT